MALQHGRRDQTSQALCYAAFLICGRGACSKRFVAAAGVPDSQRHGPFCVFRHPYPQALAFTPGAQRADGIHSCLSQSPLV